MKGKILGFNENEGIILGEDDKRYHFTLADWKENSLPNKGDKVDFEVEENSAKEIYLLEPSNYSPKIQTENMEVLSQSGLLGGLGIIGMFLSWIPLIGPILSLSGVIMLLLAVYKISKLAPQKEIFKSFLYAQIVFPLAIGLGGIVVLFLLSNLFNFNSNPNLLIGIIWIFIIIPVFVLQGIYYKKALTEIYELTQNKLFLTAATTFYWGCLLSTIGIGIFIVLVAWIITAVAFFSLRK